MPAHTPPNQPYNLTTEHGRAQSFAYSAHGAMLEEAIETCLQAQIDELAEQAEALIDKELERIIEVPRNLRLEFASFLSELGKRDANAFHPIFAEYVEERKAFTENAIVLQGLVEQLKKLIGIEEDGE